MTLPEWTKSIIDELTAAGFEAREYKGFPIATIPAGDGMAGHLERVRFLKFHTTLAADRRMYAEGCLFSPAGSWREAERIKAEKESSR
jgi:hypothetical protein